MPVHGALDRLRDLRELNPAIHFRFDRNLIAAFKTAGKAQFEENAIHEGFSPGNPPKHFHYFDREHLI